MPHIPDQIDRRLLSELQRDASLSQRELADRVGLTPSPCLRRVRQLEAMGMITGYTALVDRQMARRAYEPLVWVTLSEVTRSSMTQFERAVSEIPEVMEVLRMMGQPDYLLRVVSSGPDAFEALYIDRLAGLPFVQTLTSQLAMKVVKRSQILPLGL